MSREPEDDRKQKNAADEGEEAAGNDHLREVNEPPFKKACRGRTAGPVRIAEVDYLIEQEIVNLQSQVKEAQERGDAAKERADAAKKRADALEKLADAAKKRADAAIKRLAHYESTLTIYGLLQLIGVDNDRLRLSFRSRASSWERSLYETAQLVTKEFKMPPNIFDSLGDHVTEGLKVESSSLLATTQQYSMRVAEQQADVQFFVDAAVQDAVSMVNLFLQREAKNTSEGVKKVSIRREKGLFSNRVDHSVVFDTSDGIPVFMVQTKLPTTQGIQIEETIAGQLYDYLMMAGGFSGRRNVFGILTTFEDSLVGWLDVAESNESAADEDRLAGYKPANISKRLATADTNTKIITSAFRDDNIAVEDTLQIVSHIETRESGCIDEEQNLIRFAPLARRLMRSTKTFKANELVPVLCNAIVCSLKDCAGVKRIKTIPSPMHLGQRSVLKLMEMTYEWQTAMINLKSNPCPITEDIKPDCYYAVDHISNGTTSKAFRAVAFWDEGTETFGGECVIKMYILKYDPEAREEIESKTFMRKAKACGLQEVKRYETIYPELKGRVWQQRLAGHWCVIMPYFVPVPKPHQLAMRDEVEGILLNKFVSKRSSYRYKHSDQSWRHIGRLGDVLYLFDLADLDLVTNDKGDSQKKYAADHWQVLVKKATSDTVQM